LKGTDLFPEFDKALAHGETVIGCFGTSWPSIGALAAAAAAAVATGAVCLGLLMGPGLLGRIFFSTSSPLSTSSVDNDVRL